MTGVSAGAGVDEFAVPVALLAQGCQRRGDGFARAKAGVGLVLLNQLHERLLVQGAAL